MGSHIRQSATHQSAKSGPLSNQTFAPPGGRGGLDIPRTSICLAGKEGLGFMARCVDREEAICLILMAGVLVMAF